MCSTLVYWKSCSTDTICCTFIKNLSHEIDAVQQVISSSYDKYKSAIVKIIHWITAFIVLVISTIANTCDYNLNKKCFVLMRSQPNNKQPIKCRVSSFCFINILVLLLAKTASNIFSCLKLAGCDEIKKVFINDTSISLFFYHEWIILAKIKFIVLPLVVKSSISLILTIQNFVL